MILAEVIGEMVSTVKHEILERSRLMIVQPITPEGEPDGVTILAIDTVQAGRGDRVLINQEGHAAEDHMGVKGIPVRSLIVGIVDRIDIGGNEVRLEEDLP